MSDATLESVFIVICDWRGHISWSTTSSRFWKIGDLVWINLTRDSQEVAKAEFSQVVTLREMRSIDVTNLQGVVYRCWIWPLDSPDMAACVLAKPVPAELTLLTSRERECLELLAQGTETSVMARQLEVSLSTVHTHLKRAREKLGLPNAESLISFAARFCYPAYHPLIRQQA